MKTARLDKQDHMAKLESKVKTSVYMYISVDRETEREKVGGCEGHESRTATGAVRDRVGNGGGGEGVVGGWEGGVVGGVDERVRERVRRRRLRRPIVGRQRVCGRAGQRRGAQMVGKRVRWVARGRARRKIHVHTVVVMVF
jgi:hypothetical protein